MDVLGCVREEGTGHARHRKSHILGFPLPISPAPKAEDRTQGLDHARQVLFCLRRGLVIQTGLAVAGLIQTGLAISTLGLQV